MTKEKIALITDSGSDVPPEIVEKYDVKVLPLKVIYKDAEYLDGETISADEVYETLEKEIPSTSLPSGEYVQQAIEDIIAEGYEKIIAITISSGLSGTNNIINIVAQDYPKIDIAVIDTKSIGIGSGITAAYITQMMDEDLPFEEIVERTKAQLPDSRIYFSIPTLKYLEKGGRIGRVTSIVGSLLNVNPIISCDEEGIYHTVAKSRGRKKSINKMRDLILEQAEGQQSYNIGVAYGGQKVREEAQELLKELEDTLPNIHNSYFGSVSPALGVHTGPGLIGCTIQPIQ